MRGKLRQRVVFAALIGGLAASAMGERIGMPNSWTIFAVGAAVGITLAVFVGRRPRRRE